MGWGNCGTDSKGRPIGYVFEATCDHPDCLKSIDRGLDYSCGGMHGEDVYSCEKYFCHDHLTFADTPDGECLLFCNECAAMVEQDANKPFEDRSTNCSTQRCNVPMKPHCSMKEECEKYTPTLI